MSESKTQSKKKEIQEFKTILEVLRLNTLEKLPRIFIYAAQESFEFDLLIDHYKQLYDKLPEPYETVVYVSEEGEQESLFSELFNISMFSAWKLIIIKSGTNFFKPIFTESYKEYVKNFKRSLPYLDEKICILIHYDKKEIPNALSSLFLDKFALLKSKVLYPNERLKELENILKNEKITFEQDASDEFIHRIPPNSGAYIKNIQKLKTLIPKKHYTKEDIKEGLFASSEFNPFYLTDCIFQNNRLEFYKEFSKIKLYDDSAVGQILSFLTNFLNRLDEVRKAKILFKTYYKEEDSEEFFRHLKMEGYSPKRKYVVKERLKKEVHIFNEEILSFCYDIVVDLNIKMKSGNLKENKFYFLAKFNTLFELIR